MIADITVVVLFLGLPALVMWLCRKVSFFGKLGPILFLYLLGIIIGNTLRPEGMAKIQDLLSSAMVPAAIPLMLFGCSVSRKDLRRSAKALLTGFAAVIIAVVTGYLLFGSNIPEGAKTGAMLTGVYTGGTVNLAAIKAMLDVDEAQFVLVNSCDMLVCFLYLTLLMSVGIPLLRKFLPADETAGNPDVENSTRPKWCWRDALILIGADVVIIGISAGLGLLAGDDFFMTVLILLLTTLSLAAAFIPAVKQRSDLGYDIGMYLICVFSITVASMADFSTMDFSGSVSTLSYLTYVIFGSLIIQIILSRLLRIDADLTVITSVTCICSPPFVPMICSAMKSRRHLVSGLAIGIVGYAAGTYLGYLLYGLLSLL